MKKYKITIIVKPDRDTELVGVREDMAMYCEHFGDVESVTTEEIKPEQMKMSL